jgi:hypothetical protein
MCNQLRLNERKEVGFWRMYGDATTRAQMDATIMLAVAMKILLFLLLNIKPATFYLIITLLARFLGLKLILLPLT